MKVREVGAKGGHELIYFRAHDPLYVEIFYAGGGLKQKGVSHKRREAGWDYIKRLVKKKAFQDASEEADAQEETIELTYSHKGIGGRFKWGVRTTEVYDPSMEAVVEKHYSMYNAVVISPDSWLDKQLQRAYYARRHGPEEEKHEQQITSKRVSRQ
jgi:hypothetical protein